MQFEQLCVLGLGYIGLPTASTFATHGLAVVGVDVNRRVVDILRSGEVHIQEPGLRSLVQAALGSGHLSIHDAPREAEAFIIAVPTPVTSDRRADLSYVIAAAESIVPCLRKGNLVVLESTCPPRTTVDIVAPILERSGLTAGDDFYLAYSPERVLPGKILQELVENARVIGGVNQASAAVGRDLYTMFVRGEILLSDSTTAEMVKLMENTSRDVNIAIANEFSRLAETFGVDVWEAIDLANRHPRINILRPGPGVGGHCISVDPWFLVEAAPELSTLIQEARNVNDGQPAHVVELLSRALGSLPGIKIAALGLSYKPNVDDMRESPAITVVQKLVEAGAEVSYFEPYVPEAQIEGATGFGSIEDAVRDAMATILLVNHTEFEDIDPASVRKIMAGRTILDTRGTWDRGEWTEAGFEFIALGVGESKESVSS